MVVLTLALSIAAPAPPATAEPDVVLHRPTDDPGVKLLQEDRTDEAARPLGFDVSSDESLLRWAAQAAAAGKAGDALCGYEAYLRHFPFGRIDWDDRQLHAWVKVAAAYLDLLARTERPAAGWFRQSRAAEATYARLREAFQARDPGTYVPLADEILARYPESLYCQPAVLTVIIGLASQGHGGRFMEGVPLARSYLDRMEKAGVPEPSRLLVRLMLFAREAHESGSDGKPFDRDPETAEVVRTARSPLVRRAYLEAALERKLKAGDLPAARALAQHYVATYAPAARPGGRDNVVGMCLRAGADAEADRWVGEWRRANEPFDAAYDLGAIADFHAAAGRWAKAIERYEDALGAGPQPWREASLKRSLAKACAGKGDEARSLALLKEVAAASERSDANADLGELYTRKKDWKAALVWWVRWQPSSGCGTCDDQMRKRKRQRIEECRTALGQAAK